MTINLFNQLKVFTGSLVFFQITSALGRVCLHNQQHGSINYSHFNAILNLCRLCYYFPNYSTNYKISEYILNKVIV